MLTAVEFHARHPNRVPSWRYDRANQVASGKQQRVRVSDEDKLILAFIAYLRASMRLNQLGLPPAEVGRRLMSRWPYFYAAYDIYSAKGVSLLKTSIEARLLAGIPDDAIGERLRIPTESVAAYRLLFYDITDRLECPEYIVGNVISPVWQSGLAAFNPDLLTRYFAYFGGPLVIDHVMFGLGRADVLKSDVEALGYLEQSVGRMLKHQSMSMITTMRPDRFDVRTLIEGYIGLVTHEQNVDAGGSEQQWLTSFIEFTRGRHAIPLTLEQRQTHHQLVTKLPTGLAVEPRLYHRLELAKGNTTVDALVAQFKAIGRPSGSGGSDKTVLVPRT